MLIPNANHQRTVPPDVPPPTRRRRDRRILSADVTVDADC
jgi:hypothetical protein